MVITALVTASSVFTPNLATADTTQPGSSSSSDVSRQGSAEGTLNLPVPNDIDISELPPNEWPIPPTYDFAGLNAESPASDVIPEVAEYIFIQGADRGLSGQSVDTANRAITVWWKGEAPEDIVAFATSSPFGVTITLIEGAKYSRLEAKHAVNQLMKNNVGGLFTNAIGSVNHDGSGITLQIDSESLAGVAMSNFSRVSLQSDGIPSLTQSAIQELSLESGVLASDITIKADEPLDLMMAT
ncbi:MAG: hypothetical protein LBL55_06695, partial [Propionibacteriaceae bacterium]|nr:hypothetical protein [Propionibacteriaceae bacterium]